MRLFVLGSRVWAFKNVTENLPAPPCRPRSHSSRLWSQGLGRSGAGRGGARLGCEVPALGGARLLRSAAVPSGVPGLK